MALKKQTQIRTGKMVRELMLGDKVVSASTIMVYSNDNVNEEIKIESITPSSNEEIFSSADIDWNKSVIYKVVDFIGNSEVGKVVLDDIKKNHVSLKIERIMWKKEPNQEKVMVDSPISSETDAPATEEMEKTVPSPKIEKIKPAQEEKAQEEKAQVEIAKPVPTPLAKEKAKPVTTVQADTKMKSASSSLADAKIKSATSNLTNEKVKVTPNKPTTQGYQRLLQIAMTICTNWDLGCDLDESIDTLKAELKQQGVTSYYDEDTRKALDSIRTLKEKGINLESLLNII